MTVVLGRPCDACREPVANVGKAVGCAACDAQFHKKCLEQKGICGRCGAELAHAAREATALRERETQQTIQRGRAVLWTATAVGLGVTLLTASATVVVSENPDVLRAAGTRVVASVGAFAMIHRGSASVAKAVIALTGIGGLVTLAMGLSVVDPHEDAWQAAGSLAFAAIGAALSASAALMMFSRDFWRYIEHLRGTDQGPH